MMAINRNESLLALGIMSKLYIYNCNTNINEPGLTMADRVYGKPNRRVAELLSPGAYTQSIDWNKEQDNILAASSFKNCTIYDVNTCSSVSSFESSNTIK